MKFIVIRPSLGLELGKVYSGAIVAGTHNEKGLLPPHDQGLQIAVFNENEQWRCYHPLRFKPAKE